jgi:hypothetical protein
MVYHIARVRIGTRKAQGLELAALDTISADSDCQIEGKTYL